MRHPNGSHFHLHIEKRGEALVMRPEGGCSQECVEAMDGVISHVDSGARKNIILDASRLSYIDTPGFRWILQRGLDLQATGRALIVVGLTGSAERAFQLLQIGRFICSASSVEAALTRVPRPVKTD
jgi:anti-anti-sigma factor